MFDEEVPLLVIGESLRLLGGDAELQELAGDATMLYYMTDEAQEGGKAFLEKRRPRFEDYPKFP